MEIDKKRSASTISDPDKVYKLSALIHADSFFYALMDDEDLFHSDEIQLTDLTQDFSQHNLHSDTRDTQIAVLNKDFTIVSASDFDEQYISYYVRQVTGRSSFDEGIIRSDYIADLDAYVCYRLSKTTFNTCCETFSSPKIYHAVSALIGSIHSKPGRALIHLCRIGRQTVFIASKNGRLVVANTISHFRPLSVLYYVTLMKQTLDFSDENFDLELSGDCTPADGIESLMLKYFNNVSYRSALLTLDGRALNSSSVFFPLRSILLCA